jgi:hypothetical protein
VGGAEAVGGTEGRRRKKKEENKFRHSMAYGSEW